MVNDKKIAFIICSNNEFKLNECVKYLNTLIIPDGFETDLLIVKDAKSMLAGMEEGSNATDAKYKVYMHQDVLIINKYFVFDILKIFNSDERIGLIGMVGSVVFPAMGMMWIDNRVGNIYGFTDDKYDLKNYRFDIYDGIVDVDTVDGLLMVTSDDVVFPKDIFDGWDFYDVSLSFEFAKAGKRVVVPNQINPWCIHDDGGILSLGNYNKYRKKALEYYSDIINRERERDNNKTEILSYLPGLLECKKDVNAEKIYDLLSSPKGRMLMQKEKCYLDLFKCLMAYKLEKEAGSTCMFDNISSMEDVDTKASIISFILYRVASNKVDDQLAEMLLSGDNNRISVYSYAVFAKYFEDKEDDVVSSLASILIQIGKKIDAFKLLFAVVKMNGDKEKCAMALVDLMLDMGMLAEAKEVVKTTCLKKKKEFAGII